MEDAKLLAMKMEEGAMSQEVQGGLWKLEKTRKWILSPRVSRKDHRPADTMILAQ